MVTVDFIGADAVDLYGITESHVNTINQAFSMGYEEGFAQRLKTMAAELMEKVCRHFFLDPPEALRSAFVVVALRGAPVAGTVFHPRPTHYDAVAWYLDDTLLLDPTGCYSARIEEARGVIIKKLRMGGWYTSVKPQATPEEIEQEVILTYVKREFAEKHNLEIVPT